MVSNIFIDLEFINILYEEWVFYSIDFGGNEIIVGN